MKENYLEPAIMVQMVSIATNIMEVSSEIGGDIEPGEYPLVKEDFENFFD